MFVQMVTFVGGMNEIIFVLQFRFLINTEDQTCIEEAVNTLIEEIIKNEPLIADPAKHNAY